MIGGFNQRPLVNVGVALLLLFMASVALHTQLYRLRPAPDRLTGFYLAMSVGGALGGVFSGLIAPIVFDWTYEYPLLILAAGLLVPQVYLTHGIRGLWTEPTRRLVALATIVFALAILFVLTFVDPTGQFGDKDQGMAFIVVAAIGLASVGARLPYVVVLASALVLFGGYRSIALSLQPDARVRSYFGVYTIRQSTRARELDHGTTVHGVQLIGTPGRERTPTTYYARGSGVGQALTAAPALYGDAARIGVVGLGTGTLACYARPGQHWRFYEIDPAVVRIARDTGQFTYLRDCLPTPTIRMGDARLSLSREAPASLDVLALDAFSSDAIPMHLMTREAFATYARVLAPDGMLLVHISNRFLDLEPVVAAAAANGGWQAQELYYRPSPLDPDASASQWIALSRNPQTLAALRTLDTDWVPLVARPGFAGWTDDYSTILPLLKWRF